MTRYLPWTIIVTYCVYAIFAAQQKICIRDFRGRSQGYYLFLGYFAFFTSLFGVGFLIFYGFRTTWWASLVLFALGLLIYIPFLALESMIERIMPLTAWGLLSFITIPICGWLLVFLTPRF